MSNSEGAMTHKLHHLIQDEAVSIASRTAGLAYLCRRANVMETSDVKEGDGFVGLGELLKDLARRSNRLANFMDLGSLVGLDAEFEVDWTEVDPLSKVEVALHCSAAPNDDRTPVRDTDVQPARSPAAREHFGDA